MGADVARYVLGRAGRRERTGQPEDDDALPLHQILHGKAVGTDRAAWPLGLHKLHEGAIRQPITDLDGHHNSPFCQSLSVSLNGGIELR